MSDATARIREQFLGDERYTGGDDQIVVNVSPFHATVDLRPTFDGTRYHLTIELPSLDAVVEDQRVADVVLKGWADTLERRLREAHTATSHLDAVTYTITGNRDRVVAEMRFERSSAAPVPVEGIVALVEYAAGTYLQGVIPGYEYGPPVDEMLARARNQTQQNGTQIEPPSTGETDTSVNRSP